MAQISSIGAGIYSDLSVTNTDDSAVALTSAAMDPLFANIDFDTTAFRIENVREFPSIGTPPNVVNVPVYGQASSQQVQGQSDAPSIEVTLNFIPADWASGTSLGSLVGDGTTHSFRFALLNSKPTNWGSEAGGLGTVQNSYWYWKGKIEALQVNPQLTDANTAVLTITIQSDFIGAFTV